MAIRAEAYSSVRRLLPALFSTHPHLDKEIADPLRRITPRNGMRVAPSCSTWSGAPRHAASWVPSRLIPEPRGTGVTDVRQIRGGLSTGAIGADELLANACDCGAGKC